MSVQHCETCRAFKLVKDTIGHCIRYPPVYVGDSNLGETLWMQPKVIALGHCEEWKRSLP